MQSGLIPPKLSSEVLLQFDKCVSEALGTKTRNRVVFHSEKLCTYRFCDNVWTFLLKVCFFSVCIGTVPPSPVFHVFQDVVFKESHCDFSQVDKVKIVACDAKSAYLTQNLDKAKQAQQKADADD